MKTEDLKKSIETLTTSCDGCVFQQLEDNCQVGCHLREMPEDSFFEAYNGDKTYRIFKRLCNLKRDAEWKGDLTLLDAQEKVRSEVRLKYNVALDVKDIWGAQDSLSTLNKQDLKPDKVILVDRIGMGEQLFYLMKDSPLNCVLLELYQELPDWRDHVIQSYSSRHLYCFSSTPLFIPTNFFFNLDIALNDRGFRFGVIEDKENSDLLIISNFLYNNIAAPLRDIVENIERWAPRESVSSV